MSLKELIVNNKQVSDELVENLLKGRVELVQEGRRASLTKDGMQLSKKCQILLFLTGGKAWELLDGSSWDATPTTLEESLGIPGNTIRPILKQLADNYLVKGEKGKYQILSKGIYELESMLSKEGKKDDNSTVNKLVRDATPLVRKITRGQLISGAFAELLSEDFFSGSRDLSEIHAELGRRGVSAPLTSLPSIVLPLVRRKVLTRELIVKGKRKVWAYKKYINCGK